MRSKGRAGVIALSLVLTAFNISASWSAQSILRGIELKSSPVETRIILKSESRIPYNIVSQSSDKIILDLDSSESPQGTNTDFTAADNIEQVVLKPHGDKLRMLIRGENLGPVAISGKYPATHKRKSQLVYEAESGVSSQPKPLQQPLPEAGLNLPEGSETSFLPSQNGIAQTEAATPEASEQAATKTAMVPETTAPTPEPMLFEGEENNGLPGDRQALITPEATDQTTELANEAPATWMDTTLAGLTSIANAFSKSQGTDYSLLFRICAIGGILLLLGLYIRQKLSGGLELEGGLKRKPLPRRNTKPFNGKEYTNEQVRSRATRTTQRRGTERPVGLRGLADDVLPELPSAPIVAKNHAINQYARQSQPVVSSPINRNSEVIDHELKKSLNMRNAVSKTHNYGKAKPNTTMADKGVSNPLQQNRTMNRPATQQPAIASRRPLPAPTAQQRPVTPKRQAEPGLPANNTEVLDFLRNVAELMEKDGKPNLANGVKKGIQRTRTNI